MFKDPVCGMELEDSNVSFEYKDKKYFFCSEGCCDKFKDSPEGFTQRYIYDLVIIGGGPAGLSAAIYTSVLKIDTFLITRDIGGQAIDSSKIKNYIGFDFISGKDLINKFQHQFLLEHYLDHKIDEVINIERKNDRFQIRTRGQSEIYARSIIIATGMKRRKLGIPGEERLQRKGVSYSAVQDISLFKGLRVVVIGGGNSGIQTANNLAELKCKVTLTSKGKLIADPADIVRLKNHENVTILEGFDVVEIKGSEKVEGVVIQSQNDLSKSEISCNGVFIQIGMLPNTEFCNGYVDLNEKGEIIIKPDCSTSVKGIFACGDVTNAFGKRIIIASGEGAKASLIAREYLLKIGNL